MSKKIKMKTNSLFNEEKKKKKISVPLITSIYYDNKLKNESNYLNDLRISYETTENKEKNKKDELLSDFLKESNSVNLNIENCICKNDENNGKKYCLKCHIWLCENCIEEHEENKPLHPLCDNEINLIEICNQHLKNLTLYCNDCKKFICHECLKNSHNNHSYEKIKEKWKKEKNNLKFNYQENIEDLINDSKDYLIKYSKKTINFINKIIDDLNEIKNKIEESVEKINEDNELIQKLCEKMNNQMKLARNYPNNNIIESIKNLNLQDINNNNIIYMNQIDAPIKALKEEIFNNINKFIIFKSNPKNKNNKSDNSNNNLKENEKEQKNEIIMNNNNDNFVSNLNGSILNNSNNNNSNNNFLFNNNNNNSIFGVSNNNNNTLFRSNNNNNVNSSNSIFGSNNVNTFTMKEEKKIDPFENLKKDLEKKSSEKESKKSNPISSIQNNSSSHYLDSSFISYQETQVSESEDNEIVYVTSTGSCYHQKYCRYLWKSCIPMKKKDARRNGYKPCSRC